MRLQRGFGRDFNPRAPCGARPSFGLNIATMLGFQSTRPLRGATRPPHPLPRLTKFQSTRPLRGATYCWRCRCCSHYNFNPRAPCGARPLSAIYATTFLLFQSTRPLRGATTLDNRSCNQPYHFNPRAPCGARRRSEPALHLPPEFQSTRPLRGATLLVLGHVVVCGISIHAPLAGRDDKEATEVEVDLYFNPRAPCGARRIHTCWRLS